MDNVGVQLVSTLSDSALNELRVSYGRRKTPRTPGPVAAAGPTVEIAGVANFGGAPTSTEERFRNGQVVDNVS